MRAYSWGQVRELGLDLRGYQSSPLPDGVWTATLDVKVWAQNAALACYFTRDTGEKYRLTAFRFRQGKTDTGRYCAKDGLIDFSLAEVVPGQRYRLDTGINGKGNPLWRSAAAIK